MAVKKNKQNVSRLLWLLVLVLLVLVLVQASTIRSVQSQLTLQKDRQDAQAMQIDTLMAYEHTRQEQALRLRQEHEARAARLKMIVDNKRSERLSEEKALLQQKLAMSRSSLQEAEQEMKNIQSFHFLRSKSEKEQQLRKQTERIRSLQSRIDKLSMELTHYD